MSQGPLLGPRPIQLGQRPHYLNYTVGQQVVGVLDRSQAQNVGGVYRHLHPPSFQVSGLPGELEAPLKDGPHPVVEDQLGSKEL